VATALYASVILAIMAAYRRRRVRHAIKRAFAGLAAYIAHHRDDYVAAMLYQNLSRLSDAELERRGISRGDLYRTLTEKGSDR
jgi:hypothetical protein